MSQGSSGSTNVLSAYQNGPTADVDSVEPIYTVFLLVDYSLSAL